MKKEKTATNSEVDNVIESNYLHDYEKSFAEEVQGNMNEVEEKASEKEEHISNGLENFGVEGETAPDLFTTDTEKTENEGLLSSENNEINYEDDDLEIPAFLRRQKN
jgi:cell division protein FtsZ